MQKWILAAVIALLGWTSTSWSQEIVNLQQVNVEWRHVFPGAVDPFVTEYPDPHHLDLRNDLNVNIDTDFFWHRAYYNASVQSQTDQYQFRTVALKFEFGVRPCRYLDVYYYHRSEHLLDLSSSPEPFPREDAAGVRIYLYRGEK